MAHPAQRKFIESCLKRFTGVVASSTNILEVGSQDITGSIRDYFPDTESKCWVGLDVGKGRGVDFVIPGELIQLPDGWADVAFSTECFEHAKCWREIFLNMIRITHEDALIILTFAGIGRAAHGTIDTEVNSSPYTNDYYKNISIEDFASSFQLDKYFYRFSFEVNIVDGDTYFWGLRTASIVNTEWMTPEESLARARGQLGMVVTANRELEQQLRLVDASKKQLEMRVKASKSPLMFFFDGVARILRAVRRRIERTPSL